MGITATTTPLPPILYAAQEVPSQASPPTLWATSDHQCPTADITRLYHSFFWSYPSSETNPNIQAPIIQALELVAKGESVRHGVVKQQGYFQRLFGAESWSEWLDNRTDLGRVVAAFCNYVDSPTLNTGESLARHRIDAETLKRASQQAEEMLASANPSIEEVSVVASMWTTVKRPFVAFDQATQFPTANAWKVPGAAAIKGFLRQASHFFRDHRELIETVRCTVCKATGCQEC